VPDRTLNDLSDGFALMPEGCDHGCKVMHSSDKNPPENDPKKTHVITDFVQAGLDGGTIRMRTTGEEERQFLYVEDCCEALHALSNKYDEVPRDEELHITSFKWTKIKDVAALVGHKTGGWFVPGDRTD